MRAYQTTFKSRRFVVFIVSLGLMLAAAGVEAAKPAPFDTSKILTDADIFHCRLFLEPLLPVGAKTTPGENLALARALNRYSIRTDPDDHSAILNFLKRRPKSAWRVALLTNLGMEYRRTGWFSKATRAFREAYELGKYEKSHMGKGLVDHTIGELAELHARLGQAEEVEKILADTEGRPLLGTSTEQITAARESLWMMRNNPQEAFKCGAVALSRVHSLQNPNAPPDPRVLSARSTNRGISLDELRKLANEIGLNFQAAKREKAAEMVVPAVIHWKANHYAAVIAENSGRFVIQDPTGRQDVVATSAALDAEGSGYFLLPQGPLPPGWRAVTDLEASGVWGAGQTSMHDETGTKTCDFKAKPDCNSCGMATYNFHTQLVSLSITDMPVGYTPPRGPDMHFTVTYNQREVSEAINFNTSNFGSSKWVSNWIAYLDDDGSSCVLDSSLAIHLPGGGKEIFFKSGTNYTNTFQSGALLSQFKCPPSPDLPHYIRTASDGSQQVYGYASEYIPFYHARRMYMTKWIDPAGNVVLFNYDSHRRLVSVVDAVGKTTTISHLSDNPNLLPDYYLIRQVTDPFGRSALFDYQDGKLWKIHDPVGIVSEFQYAPGSDFINAMTTPYGTTTFSQPASSLNASTPPTGNARVIQAVDPTGAIERVEFGHLPLNNPYVAATETALPTVPGVSINNGNFNNRNSFYWDKKATELYPPTHDAGCDCDVYDYSKARITHWLHGSDGGASSSNIREREKMPMENAVYYFYAGQTNTAFVGTDGFPTKIARILDDGTTQLTQYTYNSFGRVTKEIDPHTPNGRVTSYVYGTNKIDLLRIYQRNALGQSTDPDGQSADKVAELTYNAADPPHLPRTFTDAAGQTTTYSYNSFGQVTSVDNPLHETTSFEYGDGSALDVPTGYLVSVTGPEFNLQHPVTTLRYSPAFPGVQKIKNFPDEYEIVRDYDGLDRPTQINYPDGTSRQFLYTDPVRGMTLDLTAIKDRLDRWTYHHYNSNRQIDSSQDPLGRTTLLDWCACGSLSGITDPKGNMTRFDRDLQSRVTSKIYAFSTPQQQSVSYTYENTTSRLKSMTDAKSQTTNYQYFIDDSLKQISYTNAQVPTPAVNFSYEDYYDRLHSVATTGLGTLTYAYYPVATAGNIGANQLASAGGTFPNDTIIYTYDQLGRNLSQAVNGSLSILHYDSLGRIDTTDNPLGHFSSSYDGVTSRVLSISYPNGQAANYGYFDNLNDRRLQTIQHLAGGAENLSRFDYTYDAEGTIQSWHKLLGAADAIDLTFGYDDADQLTSVLDGVNGSAYGYDLAGNRISNASYLFRPHNGSERQFATNELNQLTSVKTRVGVGPFSPAVPLSYDLNGNLTNDAAGKTYEWDAADRLVAINYLSTGNRTEFAYDGLGRRVKITELEPAAKKAIKSKIRSTQGSTVVSAKTFVWSGNTMAEERDSTGAVVTKRLFGAGEQRIGGPDAGNYYYSRDHLGSIREVTDSIGASKAQYDYDAWGNSSALTGSWKTDFGFTGHYFHQPSGMNLAMYRAYSPQEGRWISRDPIGESSDPDLYAYAQGSPVVNVDPYGLRDGEFSRVRPIRVSGFPRDTTWEYNRTHPAPVEIYVAGLFYYHQGRFDFSYHGNWGGPGWANSRWLPESGPLPASDSPSYYPPVDAEDACYEQHDRCIHSCPTCPTRGNGCVRGCDTSLSFCLWRLPHKSLRVRITAGLFDTFIPFWVH